MKLKESEKIKNYLNFDRELKKLWNIKVKVIPVIVGVLGTVHKSLGKRLEELEISGRIGRSRLHHY